MLTKAATLLSLALLTPAAIAEPPAIPLITHDPFLSVWSMSERLTDDWPRHWSGDTMGMSGMLRVDGKPFRWCGRLPSNVPPAQQTRVDINLTSTTYTFNADGAELSVTFSSPLGLADDLSRASESISTISFSARSTDNAPHDISVYLDLSAEWCTNSADSDVSWSRLRAHNLDVLSMGRTEQPVLQHSGDRRKIDWGRVYLAAPTGSGTAIAPHDLSRSHFASTGHSPDTDDLRAPRPANDDWPVLALSLNLGQVTTKPSTALALLGYDEHRAIELFERPLRPYWHVAHGPDFAARLAAAATAKPDTTPETAFLSRAREIGGDNYARLLTLAFRQVLAGHKIVADWDNTPLMFSKENTSNGCIATIDVIYPASPFFLYHNPDMLKAQLRPLMDYARSPRWKFPFAPHDLGTYPKANGQIYGGGESSEENQMPVEESGNMLIMLGALAKVEGNADFSKPYLPQLKRWAEYLKQHGLDPANQLCTDDFAGHLARNANLSAKTCIALAAYAQLLAAAGEPDSAANWRATAEDFAAKWLRLAEGPEVSVLVFGATPKDSWSQKYNLVWDRALGLNLFPAETFDREMAWYRTHLNRYGLPLDSRRSYTKLDWTTWSACLTARRTDFDAIMAPVYQWSNASPPPTRVPLSDWYETTDGKTMGMHSRTVVGGLWMPMLMDKMNKRMN